ncbi:MAG: tetratricopeptide repeat protein, partial [Geminicoccales bacterium]
LATCAITNLVFADRPEAIEAWELARADAHARGSLFAISSLSMWWGFTQYWRGELGEAEESLRAALNEFELWGYGEQQAQIYCDAFLAAVLRERGDLEGAIAALREAVAVEAGYVRGWLELGLCLQDSGALDEAIEVYRVALGRDRSLYPAILRNLTSSSKGRLWLRPADLRRALLGD